MSGTIAFVASEISVGEADGVARISIGRTGNLSQPVTISFEVTTDTATAGQDFVAPSGTVMMAAGQDRVLVDIPIVNDALSESTETLVLSITGVSSGSVGVPRTTLVNILDDENPVVDPPEPPLISDYVVTEQGMVSGLDRPVDFAFSPVDPDIVYIAEKSGRIRVYDLDADRFLPDFADLRGQVNDWEDRGLLNIALHPDFPSQPYLYAFYVVDPPEAAGLTGPAGQDSSGNRYAYLSRFTADPAEGRLKAVPGSEVVLVGGAGTSYADVAGQGAVASRGRDNIDLPASDRYLNPSDPTPPTVIDGYKQNYIKVDSLSHAGGGMAFGPDGMLYVGIGDGTLPNLADPRTVSVQDLASLSGKVLRIDPITGQGLADNPFVDPGDALTANQSKVWQLGLRNPFSIAFSEDGRLFISDTGWRTYEEINQSVAGANFGWPFFEGGDFGELLRTGDYRDLPGAAAFYQAVANGDISVTAAYRAFAHANNLPGFQFQTIVGAAFPDGSNLPAELRGDYFVLDFTDSELFAVDTHDRREVKFIHGQSGGSMPVNLAEGPDGFLWYADIASGQLGRWQIDPRGTSGGIVHLSSAKATYNGTPGADIYVVDAPNDSTGAQRDRITSFDVAAGDRVDFRPMGWESADITFTRFNVGSASEHTRVNGPGPFSLRIDEPLPSLAGGFIFATPDNAPPTATNDTAASSGGQVVINVLANDSDPDGDSLSVASFDATSANGGTIVRSGAALAYQPAAGFFGTDSFDYVVSDGNATDVGTVTVTVTGGGTPGGTVHLSSAKEVYNGTAGADIYVVDAVSDSTGAQRDRITSFDVAAGDRVDFRAMGWESADITFTRVGVGSATEHTRVNGPGPFSIRIDEPAPDLAGGFIFATPDNAPPTATNDTAASSGGQVVINVLANDSDPDGDSLSVASFDATSANGGTIVRSGAALAYQPAAGFSGTDSFDYVVSDGNATDVGTVTVTVTGGGTPGGTVHLSSAKEVYNGTAGADIYVVDAVSDSTGAQRDRITSFDVAAGDRVDFRAMGWESADITFTRVGVGGASEHTRVNGPGPFSIRIDEPAPDLAGAFLFAGDTLV